MQAKDANNNNLSDGGLTVTMTQSGSATLTAVADNDNGTYTATITSTTAETVTVTAAIGGNSVTNTAAVTFTATAGVTNSETARTLDEDGTATYTVVLNTLPTGNVTITPVSNDMGAAIVSGVMTFTTSDWNTPQTVTITGVTDSDATDETVTIAHTIAGGDYGNVTSADVTASSDG